MSIWTSLKQLFRKTNNVTPTPPPEVVSNALIQEEISVYDCMIPTIDLCFVHIQISFDNLLVKMQEKDLSYALVYDQGSDDLIGVVEEKDIIACLRTDERKDGCEFLFSPINFVPYVMDINNALKTMNARKNNMLVVVDNRGSTLGIITKASIVDFIYGYEFTNEYFQKHLQQNNSIEVDGSLLIRHIPQDWYLKEFYACYKSGTRTIGGFLGYHTGMVLKKGAQVIIGNIQFCIVEGDDKVVNRILMTKMVKLDVNKERRGN